jgi:hypothetical protein
MATAANGVYIGWEVMNTDRCLGASSRTQHGMI